MNVHKLLFVLLYANGLQETVDTGPLSRSFLACAVRVQIVLVLAGLVRNTLGHQRETEWQSYD